MHRQVFLLVSQWYEVAIALSLNQAKNNELSHKFQQAFLLVYLAILEQFFELGMIQTPL